MTDPYTGYHRYRQPDYNGWLLFEVFSKRGVWFYTSVDQCCGHVGCVEGPFNTPKEAYLNATGQETRCTIRITSRNDN